ncbi:MAG TPA: hypothetical protein PKY77_15250 [Phycisphaerae bacterium]|nr:hypothetical protein [Phycisphaerae bacterium]HRY68341.1 hypothetical protein [Phycisphaerae bacterium]HSA26776.1 hypothetical protein [Phycisphaerae bacterium]
MPETSSPLGQGSTSGQGSPSLEAAVSARGVGALAARLDKLYEYERRPVSADKLHDGRYFAAMFAGEHVAGTEFVIGALFVHWGAGASDLVFGLLLGNFLAVLSWAFVCAPIATRVRLTLYWYVRRIIGPGLTVVYNLVNALLYCCLAAAMIGVSASAVVMGLNHMLGLRLVHPGLTDVYPNSVGWVVIVLAIGALVVVLAIAGFKRLSQFSAVCSPWMFPIFLAGALATLPKLGDVRGFSELWAIANERIWTGVAVHGGVKLGFWHVAFFAWFANLAMHIGLSDMAVFRYARHWSYGFYSAFGMYLGHFCAWICAGIMGAVLGSQLNPGEMANRAAGAAGLICVLLAGWTTANPTIYRAGLALQIITPNWPRWAVTVAAGGITTIVALFPAIFMKLLDFVAIYGLMLMPIGAIIVVEHWLFPKLRLSQYWAEKRRLSVNPAALIAWLVVLVICFPIEQFTGGALRSPMELMGVHLFFRWLPGWFIAAGLYVLLAAVMGSKAVPGEPVEKPIDAARGGPAARPDAAAKSAGGLPGFAWVAGGCAVLSLAAIIALALRVFLGGGADERIYNDNMESYKRGLMLVTVIYFAAAVVWQLQREKLREG